FAWSARHSQSLGNKGLGRGIPRPLDHAIAGRSFRLEVHRHAVDAVAQSGGRRPVRKDVAEMAAAAAAMHLGANHAVAPIHGLLDRAILRIIETRPAGAALEFLLRLEQRLLAAGTTERAGALFEIERTAARPLGAVLAHDVELLGRQDLAPLSL